MKGKKKRVFQFEPLERRFAFAGPSLVPSNGIEPNPPCGVGCSSITQAFPRQTETIQIHEKGLFQVGYLTPLAQRTDAPFSRWLDLHRPFIPTDLETSIEPEALLLAQRSMFLQANSKLGLPGVTLSDAISESPEEHFWGSSGEAVNFLEAAFDAFHIAGQFTKVQLWHTASDHSVAIEYYSNAFGKSVFYDPLYGVILLDENGVPAGIHELFSQLIKFGRNFESWRYQPVQLDGLLSSEIQSASDPDFQFYLQRDYRNILLHYTNLISFVDVATTTPPSFHTTVLHAVDSNAIEFSSSIARDALTYFANDPNGPNHASIYRMEITQTSDSNDSGVAANERLMRFVGIVAENKPIDDRELALKSWISRYLSEEEIHRESDPVVQLLIAYRRMSRLASNHETSGTNLFLKILADPGYRGWGHAGVSVDFLLSAIEVYKIQSYKVKLWHTSEDSHTLLGYYNTERIQQLVDPLYGRVFVESGGARIGLAHLQKEISRLGMPGYEINLFSQKVDKTETGGELAVDEKFQHFISNDWTPQASYYLNLLDIETYPRALPQIPSPKNLWVLEQVNLTRSPGDLAKYELLANFAEQYSYSATDQQSVNFLNRYDPEQYLSYPAYTPSRITESAVSLIENFRTVDTAGFENSDWIDRWLVAHSDGAAPQMDSLAERILASLRRMFLTAEVNEQDVGVNLVDYLQSDPQGSLWAQCGSTADFLMRVFRRYGIPARRVQMWHDLNDHHVAIEYFSQAAGKFVFYDPLYARVLLSSEGIPASFEEVSLEAQRSGVHFDNWVLRPVMFGGVARQDPTDERLDQFFNHDYLRILKYYLNITAVELESTVGGDRPSEWAEHVYGTWSVVMRPDYSDLRSLPNSESIFERFRIAYEATERGRFYLASSTTGDADFALPTPVFPMELWDRFVNQIGTRLEGLQSATAAVRLWLSTYQPRWINTTDINEVDAFTITYLDLVTRDRNISEQAIRQLAQSLGGDLAAEEIPHMSREEQLIWFLKQLNSEAYRVLLSDNENDSISLIEYTSPGQRKQTLVNVATNQMYVDTRGQSASIQDLLIDYERSRNQENTPRFIPLNLAMLDPQQSSNPWLLAATRRATPGQDRAIRRGTAFFFLEHSGGVFQTSNQVWSLRHLSEADKMPYSESLWLRNQGRRLLALKYGFVGAGDAQIAPLFGSVE